MALTVQSSHDGADSARKRQTGASTPSPGGLRSPCRATEKAGNEPHSRYCATPCPVAGEVAADGAFGIPAEVHEPTCREVRTRRNGYGSKGSWMPARQELGRVAALPRMC